MVIIVHTSTTYVVQGQLGRAGLSLISIELSEQPFCDATIGFIWSIQPGPQVGSGSLGVSVSLWCSLNTTYENRKGWMSKFITYILIHSLIRIYYLFIIYFFIFIIYFCFFAVMFFENFVVSQAKRTVFLTVTDLYFINTIYPGTIYKRTAAR